MVFSGAVLTRVAESALYVIYSLLPNKQNSTLLDSKVGTEEIALSAVDASAVSSSLSLLSRVCRVISTLSTGRPFDAAALKSALEEWSGEETESQRSAPSTATANGSLLDAK